MSQFKIPLIVCVAVFILSALLAFVGGTSYFGIVFKAFVSALIAMAFTVSAKFLLEKYVPELFENSSAVSEGDSSLVGTNVDVRIGGDQLSSGNEAPAVPKENSSVDDVSSMEGLSDDALAQEDPLKDVEMEEPDFKTMNFKASKKDVESVGVEDVPLQNSDANAEAEKKTRQDLTENSAVPLEKKESMPIESTTSTKERDKPPLSSSIPSAVDDEKLSQEEMNEAMEKDVNRLEELPDLQEFVDSSAMPKQSKAEELMSGGTQTFFETNLSEDAGGDTKLMANAIRTVLRRD